MIRIKSKKELVDYIIENEGDCYDIHCYGGRKGKPKISNLGVPCPLIKECQLLDSEDNYSFLNLAIEWKEKNK